MTTAATNSAALAISAASPAATAAQPVRASVILPALATAGLWWASHFPLSC